MRPNNSQDTSLIVAFICQPGELEIKSLFLAYSLRKFLKIDFIPLVLIPENFKLKINAITNLLFRRLGVEIRFFKNTFIDYRKKIMPGEGMSNKFFGLSLLGNQSNILFLDSDIVCLNNFPDKSFIGKLAAKPADYSLKANWNEVYQMAGIPYPEKIIKCTSDGVESPPYFNTGVVFVSRELNVELCKRWYEYFLFFSRQEILGKKLFNPFHRDQLAFALAVEKLNQEILALDETYNFPTRGRNKVPEEAIFAHYHDCYTVASTQVILDLFQSFIIGYPELKKLLDNQLRWHLLANRKFRLLNHVKVARMMIKKMKKILRNFR